MAVLRALGGAVERRPSRGWTLQAAYPVLAVLVAVFVAYPMVNLLAHAVTVEGRLSLAPLIALVADALLRRALRNTLLLGGTLPLLGPSLAPLYACPMTRVAIPCKRLC